jgi:alpha-beta hydrolase superfamily lysophospholipase
VSHPVEHDPGVVGIEQGPVRDGVGQLMLHTRRGPIACRFHPGRGREAVVWVGGVGGGLDGPAGGLFPRLAARLASSGLASLRVDYRRPTELRECVHDARAAIRHLPDRGLDRLALVGHSAGGAVVIAAGARSPEVLAVAALSSQTYGTQDAPRLSPRPLFLAHGAADEILPAACSQEIFARALEPKQLRVYPGCRHGLEECRDALDDDLSRFLLDSLRPTGGPAPPA